MRTKSPTIALVHGGSHGSWCWDELSDTLRDRSYLGAVIALDVPGCGTKRVSSGADASLDEIADELNADVRRASSASVLLVGHSMAGILLPRMVSRAPGLYAESCFLACCIPREGESVAETMGPRVVPHDPAKVGWPASPEATQEEIYEQAFGLEMTREQIDRVVANARQDNWPRTAALTLACRSGFPGTTRVSYIATRRDPILPPEWQGRFAERLGTERLYALDTPHEPFITHPAELAALLMTIADQIAD